MSTTSAAWKIEFDEPPALLIERDAQCAQQAIFPPGECPGTSLAGLGRPAEGPIKPFFVALYRHQHRGVVLPERITEEWLRSHHLAPNNEGRLLHTLRFVGLLDSADEPVHRLWHLNQADPAALYWKLLEIGYDDLEGALYERPSWGMVTEWMRARLHGSEQMIQRRVGFHQHLRLAAHLGIQGYDALKRAARGADWNALLPPVPPGGPKLRVVRSEQAPVTTARASAPAIQPAAQLGLQFPPLLEVIRGG